MMLRFPPVASVSKAQLHLLRPSPLEGEGRGRGLLEAAIHAMDRRGVRYGFRKGSELVDPYQPGAEVDIMIDPNHTRLAEHALTSAGFRRLRAPGHPHHRFYLAFDAGHWLKIDAKIAAGDMPESGWRWRAAAHLLTALAQRRPLSLHRAGPVIALLGPDGAGKGTVIEALRARIPVGLTTVYLGERRRRGPGRTAPVQRQRVSALRECAFVLYRALRFESILLRAYLAAWSGHIVICDRHPIEALAIRPRTTRIAAALEGFLFGRLMPWPDAVALLDAPGHILFERKQENSPQELEGQRQRYRTTFAPRGARVISSLEGLESTIAQTSTLVWTALKERRRW